MFLLCLKIFLARIVDVCLNTIRTVYIVKGNKFYSVLLAFIELLIWYYAAREALVSSNSSIFIALSYSLGYSCGTLIGMIINDIFNNSIYVINVISSIITLKEINKIRKLGYGVSSMKIDNNKMHLIISINRKKYNDCIKVINKIDKNCFIYVNEAKVVHNGYFK